MLQLTVNGMTCGNCVKHVTQAIHDINPQATVEVDLSTKRVTINGDVALEAVQKALAEEGYEALPA